jgi:hypothetical protein
VVVVTDVVACRNRTDLGVVGSARCAGCVSRHGLELSIRRLSSHVAGNAGPLVPTFASRRCNAAPWRPWLHGLGCRIYINPGSPVLLFDPLGQIEIQRFFVVSLRVSRKISESKRPDGAVGSAAGTCHNALCEVAP